MDRDEAIRHIINLADTLGEEFGNSSYEDLRVKDALGALGVSDQEITHAEAQLARQARR